MKRLHWLVGAAVLAAVTGLFAWRPQLLERVEYQLHDWRFRVRGAEAPRAPVLIVAIDARSVDELGRWPWRRSVLAGVIDRLSEAGVAALGFDVVFSEPETPPEVAVLREAAADLTTSGGEARRVLPALDSVIASSDTDARLEAAIRDSDRVVLGYFFRTLQDVGVEGEGSDRPLAEALPLVRKSRVVTRVPPEMQPAPFLRCSSVETNLERFSRATRRMGFFNARPDIDGVVRRAQLLARCGDDFYKSLSLALYELVIGKKAALIWDTQGFVRGLRVADALVPVDEGGRVLVNYRGPPRTFRQLSAVDVLRGDFDAAAVEGAVAIIGATEVGIQDVYASPFTNVAPGVEVHATVLDNMLAGDVLRRSDGLLYAELALVLALGLLTGVAVPRLRGAVPGLVFSVLLLAAVVGGAVYAFIEHGLMLNLTFPMLAVGAMYVAMTATRLASEEAQARWIRNTFATFVPPVVVDEMIRNPDEFVLGGRRRDLSLLFSDIRGFTTLSEELGPENTTRLLNEYLTPMTEILFASRGTLDKYIGDAIVAFWGAPLPVEDHPRHAAEAALAMQEAIARIRETRGDLPGADRLQVGIGIHAAEVNVGKMGSALRFDYTVSGDGVNLCSRLEGITKQYGAQIIASQDLVDRLPEGFLVRPLDCIRVKGRHEPVEICELLGRRGPEGDEKDWLEAYAAGLQAYRAGRFEAAESALRHARAVRGEDRACDLLLERVGRLRAEPPADWDGVWAFETK